MLGLGHGRNVEAEVTENGNAKDSRMVHGRDGDDYLMLFHVLLDCIIRSRKISHIRHEMRMG
jgi:hypothetical protein